jgi:ABC-2 type transport system ATP-binding protein
MLALSVRALRKTYPNGLTALKGIDLDVEQGDFFALLGQNGAGKSTTIGIICSLINKSSGKVSVFGHDTDIQLAEAKSLIGVVPQEINFNSFEKISSILINQAGYYGIPQHIAKPRMETYLSEMGLWEMRDQPAIRLSGGMKRRLMIARSLMNEPKLLILDEPTAGVDIELRHHLWRFLTKLNEAGTTIILTTHYLEEAEHLCKHVAIIDHGDIIEHANMKTLINQLHVQTMVMDMAEPVKTPLVLDDYTWRMLDGTSMEIEINRYQSLNELFSKLSMQNITITSMRNKTNRLEELFIRLITQNKNQAHS